MLAGKGLLQQLDSVPAFRLFRELLQVRARGEGEGWQVARVRTEGIYAYPLTPALCP